MRCWLLLLVSLPMAIADVLDVGVTIISNSEITLLTSSMPEWVSVQLLGVAQLSYTTNSQTCPEGFYCTSSDSQAHACPMNTYNPYQNMFDSSACLECPAYMLSTYPGANICSVCPAGTHLRPDPYASNKQCTTCPAGSSSHANATGCNVCGPGTYAIAGSSECTQCPAGSFAPASGNTACATCTSGTFTFTTPAVGVYIPVLGSVSADACIGLPTTQRLCLPGTYWDISECKNCPLGYVCPTMSLGGTTDTVRICPNGMINSYGTPAKSSDECTSRAPPTPYAYQECPITSGTNPLSSLVLTAGSAPRSQMGDQSIVLATATALYRLMLGSLRLEHLTGTQDTEGSAWGSPSATLFTSITAVGTEQSGTDADLYVVGDAASKTVTLMQANTRESKFLGSVQYPSGIALRHGVYMLSSRRLVYVADRDSHNIRAFDIDNSTNFVIAGSRDGSAYGQTDGPNINTKFKSPMSIAFMESNMELNRYLLVADSGNGVIRQIDTLLDTTITWFAASDLVHPEMIQPMHLSVSTDSSSNTLVYVIDAGYTPARLSVISRPTGHADLVITQLYMDSTAQSHFGSTSMLFPGPTLVSSTVGPWPIPRPSLTGTLS